MQPQSHDTLYAHTMVLFWPWLWWQLFKLDLWMRASGRDVMFAVDRWGNLHVTAISDDPALWKPSPYPHLHDYYLTTRLTGETDVEWCARLEATYAPGFGVQAWIISPRALGELAAEICRPELPSIRDPVVLPALRPYGSRGKAGSSLAAPAHEPSSRLYSQTSTGRPAAYRTNALH